jgi:hypothetical protein
MARSIKDNLEALEIVSLIQEQLDRLDNYLDESDNTGYAMAEVARAKVAMEDLELELEDK